MRKNPKARGPQSHSAAAGARSATPTLVFATAASSKRHKVAQLESAQIDSAAASARSSSEAAINDRGGERLSSEGGKAAVAKADLATLDTGQTSEPGIKPRVPLFVPPRRQQATTTATSEAFSRTSKAPLSSHDSEKDDLSFTSSPPHDRTASISKLNKHDFVKQHPVKLITGHVEDVSSRFAKFRTDVVRSVLFGVHCLVFGGGDEVASSHSIILIQRTREEFDFVRLFENVSLLRARFIVLEEAAWSRASLVDTFFVLNRGLGAEIPFSICAGGTICHKVMESVAQYRTSGGSIASCAFVFPSVNSSNGFMSASGRLGGLEKLNVYLELDCLDTRLEQTIRASGCAVHTCITKQTLQDFLRGFSRALPDDDVKVGSSLTHYRPPSSVETKSSSDAESSPDDLFDAKLLASTDNGNSTSLELVRRIDNVIKQVFLWASSSYGETPVDQSLIPSARLGDVGLWSSEGKSFCLMRLDDPLRLSFIRYAHKNGGLPRAVLSPTKKSTGIAVQSLDLSDLLNGTEIEEGRRDMRVRIVSLDGRGNQLVCTDASLPQGLFGRIFLQRPFPGALHVLNDFIPGKCYELRNARLEADDKNKSLFKVVLDSFSSRCEVASLKDAYRPVPTNRDGPQLVTVNDLCTNPATQMTGEYRVEAKITDVLFYGHPYTERMQDCGNVFAFAKMLVDDTKTEFRECILQLGDGVSDSLVSVVVPTFKFNEIFPFIRCDRIMSRDIDARHQELVLFKRIADALIYEHNPKCDFALKREELDGPLELLTMDI